jgi:hypothetical protein
MRNRKDCPRDSKYYMQAIWNPHNINVIAEVERPCYCTEYIRRDIGNPHDPIYNAIGAQLVRHPTEMASAQGFEPIPMPDNVYNNAGEPRYSKTDVGIYPRTAGKL